MLALAAQTLTVDFVETDIIGGEDFTVARYLTTDDLLYNSCFHFKCKIIKVNLIVVGVSTYRAFALISSTKKWYLGRN